MAPSVLWFAAIQCVERKQDLADLAPKGRFISAELVKRIVGQIGETQKAMRQVGVGIDRFRPGIRQNVCSARVAIRFLIEIETDRVQPARTSHKQFSETPGEVGATA